MHERLQQFISLTVNGHPQEFAVGNGPNEIPPSETLAHTLRDRLNLMGTKLGCEQGACGCCTVIMDGKSVTSCMTLTVECDGSSITTIEGLAEPDSGKLSGLQQKFVEHCGFQCGFCTPGILMTTQALLNENPNPTEQEVREALAGNYCRCGTHYTAVESIMEYVGQRGVGK